MKELIDTINLLRGNMVKMQNNMDATHKANAEAISTLFKWVDEFKSLKSVLNTQEARIKLLEANIIKINETIKSGTRH